MEERKEGAMSGNDKQHYHESCRMWIEQQIKNIEVEKTRRIHAEGIIKLHLDEIQLIDRRINFEKRQTLEFINSNPEIKIKKSIIKKLRGEQ